MPIRIIFLLPIILLLKQLGYVVLKHINAILTFVTLMRLQCLISVLFHLNFFLIRQTLERIKLRREIFLLFTLVFTFLPWTCCPWFDKNWNLWLLRKLTTSFYRLTWCRTRVLNKTFVSNAGTVSKQHGRPDLIPIFRFPTNASRWNNFIKPLLMIIP